MKQHSRRHYACDNPAALLIILCEGYLTTPVYALYAKRSKTIIHIHIFSVCTYLKQAACSRNICTLSAVPDVYCSTKRGTNYMASLPAGLTGRAIPARSHSGTLQGEVPICDGRGSNLRWTGFRSASVNKRWAAASMR